MSRSTQQSPQTIVFTLFTCVVTLLAASSAEATIVGAQADGDDMAGGLISVFFQGAGQVNAPIVAGGPGEGTASAAGLFNFSVTGDTFLAPWIMTNLTSGDFIDRVVFDLSNSASLFDDGSMPDTMNGFAGRAGAVQISAPPPTIFASGEINLWGDAMNAGDEYVDQEILFEDFRGGTTVRWRDDTDIIGIDTGPEVPEPTTAALILLAGIGLACRRRRTL